MECGTEVCKVAEQPFYIFKQLSTGSSEGHRNNSLPLTSIVLLLLFFLANLLLKMLNFLVNGHQ